MSRLFSTCSLFLLLLASLFASAQPQKLREVRVRGRKKSASSADIRLNRFSDGMQQLAIDSSLLRQYALQQLSQLLSQQSSVFVRSYGINSMATLNFRGASAAQSQVLWNGVPLNNANVGATDVSLLTTNQFDRIHLLYGGSSSLLGSGNVGGALLLDNEWRAADTVPYHAQLGLEYASFGQLRANMQQSVHSGRWMGALNINGRVAENNFSFTDQQGVKQNLQHAELRSGSVLAQSAYQVSDSTFVRGAFWIQDYRREIPAALFESRSEKLQKDRAIRAMLHAQLARSSNTYYGKLSASEERMQYADSLIALQTQNKVQQAYLELGWRRALQKGSNLLVFIPTTLAVTRPDGDSVQRRQWRIAIATAYSRRFLQDRVYVGVSGRAEAVNDKYFVLPGLNASWQLFPIWKLRFNIQRSYRVPTLNELYFVPGGNPQLKPEQGWSADAGYDLDVPLTGSLLFHQESSVFSRHIHDWVYWFGGSIWTPHNIATVHSRGIETVNTMSWRARRSFSCWLGLNTSFVLATTLASYQPGDGSIGKQIPYSPRYNGQASIGCSWKSLRLHYSHTYTGYRFITVDESSYLMPYHTGNLYAAWSRQYGRYSVTVSAFVNNIANTSYEVVAGRPMPGRNAGLGFSAGL